MSRPAAAILDADGLRLSAAERALFRETDPWGFILFARNVDTPDQLRALTSDMREAVGRNAPVLIDQEGGRVQRLGPPHWRAWPPALDQVARAGPHAAAAMRLRSRLIAAELGALGIDVNCAPVLDVAQPDTHPILRNRCYGTDAGGVAEIGRAVAEGLLAGGVLPVIKHMPGHGRARVDSHRALPRIDAPPDLLDAVDFAPFRALRDLPIGMSAHVVLPDVAAAPVTVAPEGVALIRDRICFDGLLLTDDLSMQALSGTPASRAAAAIAAGCDVALYCNGPMAERRAVAEAAGPLNDAAMARATRALSQRGDPDSVDIAALEADLEAIMSGQGADG